MKILIVLLGVIVAAIIFKSCKPIKTFMDPHLPKENHFVASRIDINPGKRTVVILADNYGTEIFDLLAPFHIMHNGQLNVLIVSPERSSIPLWKGLNVFPHLSLKEFDKKAIKPDLVIIPNILHPSNDLIQNWIASYETDGGSFLTVCEGSRVIAESQLFDGKRLTSHHSSINQQEKKYPEIDWVRGYRFVRNENLISTAGIVSAIEGSLEALKMLSTPEMTIAAMEYFNYPHDSIKRTTSGRKMKFIDVWRIINKTAFRTNKDIAIYLPDGFNELQVGAIIDTYNRSFPKSLSTFIQNGRHVTSLNGLATVPNANIDTLDNVDEMLIPVSKETLDRNEREWLKSISDDHNAELTYFNQDDYIFHQLYQKIKDEYGKRYASTVFTLLDYDIASEISIQE